MIHYEDRTINCITNKNKINKQTKNKKQKTKNKKTKKKYTKKKRGKKILKRKKTENIYCQYIKLYGFILYRLRNWVSIESFMSDIYVKMFPGSINMLK